jgi:hypothetical protein
MSFLHTVLIGTSQASKAEFLSTLGLGLHLFCE